MNQLNNLSNIASIISCIVSIISLIVTIIISNNVKKVIKNDNKQISKEKGINQNLNGKGNSATVSYNEK